MRNIVFSQTAIDQLVAFKSGNQKLVFKILDLIAEIQKSPFEGKGKPEALMHNLAGFWSRRITDEHRLVYKVTEENIEVYSCSGHY